MAYVKGQFDVTQNVDANGDPATSYILKFFVWNTSTPTAVYSDSSGTSAGTEITLNSLGQPQSSGGTAIDLFFDDAVTYKAQLYQSDGTTTVGPVIGPYNVIPGGASGNADKSYASIAALIASSGNSSYSTLYIESYYAVTYPSTDGPKGSQMVHRTGGTNASPTVGTAVSVSTIGTGTQAGYYWDADGNEWKISEINEPYTFEMFGGVGDGTEGDAAACSGALNSGKEVLVTAKTWRIESSVTVSSPVRVTVSPGATIKPDLGAGGGKVLAFETNDVHVDGLIFDGTGLSYTLTSNQYLIFGGDGNTKYKNHVYKNCRLKDVSSSDGNTGASNLIVNHGIYVDNVDNVTITHNEMDTLSGAGIFTRDIDQLEVRFNKLLDCVWYPIHCSGGISNFEIAYNHIDSSIANGVFYGGGIDLMSQHSPLETRNSKGSVHHNYLTGKFSYGSVIRALSCEDVDIHDNTLNDVSVGAVALGATLTGIRVDTRGTGVGAENGPCKNVSVFENTLTAGATSTNEMIGIYASNQWQGSRTIAENIKIYDNRIDSVDTSNYWESAILVHGNEGGQEDVYVHGNVGTTYMQSGPVVDGAIGFVATNTQGKISGVHLGNNRFTDLGTPAASYQTGIGIGAYVDEVFNDATNKMDNYYYGVRTFTNSGPTLEYLNDFYAETVGSSELLLGVTLSKFKDLGQVSDTTSLAGVSDAINAQGKFEGKQVFNATTNKPVYASGSNASSVWVDATGATAHTPV